MSESDDADRFGASAPPGAEAATWRQKAAADRVDVAVIGGGVVGCAIARALTLAGRSVLLIEKARDILDGASKGNSAILHTGFDAPVGSLEQRLMADGYRAYRDIREKLGLPLMETGALVLAWSHDQADRLPALIEQARANGVTDVEALTAEGIRTLEPNLSDRAVAGFRVPGEHIVDPWSAPYAYLRQAVENGARLLRGTAVTGGDFDGTEWRLRVRAGAENGQVRARAVVNAAGLFGDRVEASLLGAATFTIKPRKGQFVVYDKPAARLTRHTLLPVPTETTKGIVVCRTAFGNLLVGPTAEEQEDRTRATMDRETLDRLRQAGEAILPGLAAEEITAIYAGLRPATEAKEYRIRLEEGAHYVCVGGIRSTGLSAALGIAGHVEGLCAAVLGTATPLADPRWPAVRNIAEEAPRDWQAPGNGGIVCHCERVTRREVADALTGPLAVGSLAGLKRRTRATLGRCQGFYCLAELARLTDGHLDPPIALGDTAPTEAAE